MLKHRLIFGSILAAVALGVLYVDGFFAPFYPILFVASLVMGVLCTREYCSMLDSKTRPNFKFLLTLILLVIISNWTTIVFPSLKNISPWIPVFITFVFAFLATFLYEMYCFTEPGGHVERMGLTMFGLVYLGLLTSCFIQLRWVVSGNTAIYLFVTIFVPKCGDIGAYTAGRLFGKHKMTPYLSPKKTWEGFAGAVLASVAVSLISLGISIYWGLSNNPVFRLTIIEAILFGVVFSVFGILGDLAESLLKRDAGVKDAAQSIPGFGGLLDVVDSVLFSAPIAYFWFATMQYVITTYRFH